MQQSLNFRNYGNKNCIFQEMKSRLKLGNVCYQGVHNPSKHINIKIYRTIFLPGVLVSNISGRTETEGV
jgi:hypothetical protein